MKLTKSFVLVFLCGILAIGAGAGLRLYFALHAKSGDIYSEIADSFGPGSPQYNALKEQGRFNILIMGEDNVEGSRRSDTILFAAIDIDDKNMKILSIPRDTRVEIPGHGVQKINHAFAYGGADLMKATVEKYLGQPILYYVIVDYDSFPALVDILGGVEIDVQKKMRYRDRAGKLDINIEPGKQIMNGVTALHFVRFRKDALGDIGRVQRQQQFLKALIKKAYDPRTIIKIPELTAQMMKLFKTDMPPKLAIQLAGFVQNELGRDRIFFSTLHGTAATIGNLSYWLGDVKLANAFLNASVEELISGDLQENSSDSRFAGISLAYSNAMENTSGEAKNAAASTPKTTEGKQMSKDQLIAMVRSMPEAVAVLNGTGKSGVGEEVASRLQKIGIDVVHTGNAKHFDYRFSNVVYPLNANKNVIETAKTLGKLLNVPGNLVRPNKQAFYASIIVGHDSAELIKQLDRLVEISSK